MKQLYKIILPLIIAILGSSQAKAQFANKGYESLMKDTTRGGLTELYFVGTGDIQLAYNGGSTNDKKIAASTGLGVLFWRIWPNGRELQLDARVNVASTVDTISALLANNTINDSRVFGRYLLVPAASGQATFINTLWYFDRPFQNLPPKLKFDQFAKRFKLIDGIEVGGAASNQVWRAYSVDPTTNTAQTIHNVNASVLAVRAGVFHEFVPQDIRRKGGTSIRLGLNGIVRSLQGDIGRNTSAMEDLRKKFIGSTYTVHYGGEILLALRLRNIRAEAALPFTITRGFSPIPGLSGTQFVTSISFVGGFPLKITDEPKDKD